jgi:hypothetical protein
MILGSGINCWVSIFDQEREEERGDCGWYAVTGYIHVHKISGETIVHLGCFLRHIQLQGQKQIRWVIGFKQVCSFACTCKGIARGRLQGFARKWLQ